MTGQRGPSSTDAFSRRDQGEGSSSAGKQQADITEWRSRGQLEPAVSSTSPGYWSDDDDGGPKPSDLYGKFTWKIENFSEISKRELRSNVFEVGGYKWYILVYPQGCDVCNHLSLFLCVADYDKLLPGWSHFAQFTIAVVNKDPKKSKYSDTLHRFCKKEHDWGWKKFMELSKVLDGFTVADTLVIKAQVQVIRENAGRPFRCLDCQYRRELVRVYLTNVEGICRRFVEEKREKLGKLMDDSVRWQSFRAFWSAVEDGDRRRLANEKADVILKAVVKRFFNEKEVTSTLVMDALYSGCKALDREYRSKNSRFFEDETSAPTVWIEKDSFLLGDDVICALQRAVTEPIPPYKDDKSNGTPNRTKEGTSGDDFGKDSVERDERRLAELGRRTIEMFVLSHLFTNRVEVAYREAVALKRQEELIREEEEAEQAESERRREKEALEKEKKAKRKKAKQRKKDRKDEERRVREDEEQRLKKEKEASVAPGKDRLASKGEAEVVAGYEEDEEELEEPDEADGYADAETEEAGPTGVCGKAGAHSDDGEPEAGEDDATVWVDAPETAAAFHKSAGTTSSSKRHRKEQVSARTTAGSGRAAQQQERRGLDETSSTASSDSGTSGSMVGWRAANLPGGTAVSGNGIMAGGSKEPGKASLRRVPSGLGGTSDTATEGAEARTFVVENGGAGGQEAASSSGSGDVDDGDHQEAIVASLRERVQWLEQRLVEKEEEILVLQQQLQLVHPFSLDVAEASERSGKEPPATAGTWEGDQPGETSSGPAQPEIAPPERSAPTGGAPTASTHPAGRAISTPHKASSTRPSSGSSSSAPSTGTSASARGGQGTRADAAKGVGARSRAAEVQRGPRTASGAVAQGTPDDTASVAGVSGPWPASMGQTRPSSAPTAARPSVPQSALAAMPQAGQGVPVLARTVSTGAVAGRSAADAGSSAPSNGPVHAGPGVPVVGPVVPSYRNAAAGRMRAAPQGPPAASVAGLVPYSSSPPSVFLPMQLAQPSGAHPPSGPASPSPPLTPTSQPHASSSAGSVSSSRPGSSAGSEDGSTARATETGAGAVTILQEGHGRALENIPLANGIHQRVPQAQAQQQGQGQQEQPLQSPPPPPLLAHQPPAASHQQPPPPSHHQAPVHEQQQPPPLPLQHNAPRMVEAAQAVAEPAADASKRSTTGMPSGGRAGAAPDAQPLTPGNEEGSSTNRRVQQHQPPSAAVPRSSSVAVATSQPQGQVSPAPPPGGPANLRQRPTPPHHAPAAGPVDSPGLSEDFPHLSLINDLLDEGDFLGMPGFEGQMPTHPMLARKLHPSMYAGSGLQAGRGDLSGHGEKAARVAVTNGMMPPAAGTALRKDAPAEFVTQAMRPREAMRHPRPMAHAGAEAGLANGNAGPGGPPHYQWVPAHPGGGYSQPMHTAQMLGKAGGPPAYVLSHASFVPYQGTQQAPAHR